MMLKNFERPLQEKIVFLMIFSSIGSVYTNDVPHYKAEASLHTDLLLLYKPHVRPAVTLGAPVKVHVYPTIIRLEGIDESADVLSTTISITMGWKDPRLIWAPEHYSNISSTYLPLASLWQPDISLHNAAPVPDSPQAHALARVSSMGNVLVTTYRRLHSYCALDLTDYPRDTQTCTLKLGSWMYSANQLMMEFWGADRYVLSVQPGGEDSDVAVDNQYWELVGGSASGVIERVMAENPYDVMKISLKIKRLSSDMLILGTPLVIVGFLVPWQFLLPVSSGNRTIYGMATLVLMLILLQGTTMFIPTGHSTLPRIAAWYVANIVCTVLSTILSTCCVSIGTRHTHRPVSPIIKQFMVGAQHVLCMKTKVNTGKSNIQEIALLENGSAHERTEVSTEVPDMDIGQAEMDTTTLKCITEISKFLKTLASREKSKLQEVYINQEWRDLTAVLDRIFFILFFGLFCLNFFIYL